MSLFKNNKSLFAPVALLAVLVALAFFALDTKQPVQAGTVTVIEQVPLMNPAADLDQIRNGSAAARLDPPDWVNGNAGPQNAHYVEGYSIGYRVVLTDLPMGEDINLILEYDIKHGGTHAIDYLTHFQRLEPHASFFSHASETVDPRIGVPAVSVFDRLPGEGGLAPDTANIPAPSSTSPCASPVADYPTDSFTNMVATEGPLAGQMTLYGGSFVDGAAAPEIEYVTEGCLTGSNESTSILVSFQATQSTVVLAWGGHIAMTAEVINNEIIGWDAGNAAGGINGSPYHMRTLDWNLSNLGHQDRSLKASAVQIPTIIIIEKLLNPVTAQEFVFTGNPSGLLGHGEKEFEIVPAGQYLSTETEQNGWQLVSISCDDADSTGNGLTATFNTDEGEIVTCTFNNEGLGNIIVEKQTLPNGDPETFDYSGDITDTLSDGQQSTPVQVTAGAHSATETVPSGWDLTDISCDDGNSTGNTGTATASFEVEPGETVICTFTNTKRGSITVVKEVDPSTDTTEFDFTLSPNPNNEVSPQSLGHLDSFIWDNLRPDSYTLDEDVWSYWNLTDIYCNDAETSKDLFTGATVIDLAAGQEVTCTYTNTKQGQIIIEKETKRAGLEVFDTQDFRFTGTGTGVNSPFFLDTDGDDALSDSKHFSNLITNQVYTVTETGAVSPSDSSWHLTSISCDNVNSTVLIGGDIGYDDGDTTVSITLAPGETVTCTYTNEQSLGLVVLTCDMVSDELFESLYDLDGGDATFVTKYSVTGLPSANYGDDGFDATAAQLEAYICEHLMQYTNLDDQNHTGARVDVSP